MTVIIQDRLAAVADVKLDTGGHSEPDGIPGEFCVMEKFAWVTGQDWTDSPENCSDVIGAFLRRWNDTTDQAGRDRLDEWVITNADAIVATARDGKDRQRGYLAADWAVHTALPIWLEIAGAPESAEAVRKLAPITDRDSANAAADATYDIRREMWRRRDVALEPIREAVRVAVKEKWGKQAAGAAVAAGAAGAAEAAVAAVAAGAAGYWPVYDAVYKAVRAKVAEILTPKIRERLGPKNESMQASALELLDRMVAL